MSNVIPSLHSSNMVLIYHLRNSPLKSDWPLLWSFQVTQGHNSAFGPSIYNFLLVSNSNHLYLSYYSAARATRKIFFYHLSLGRNFGRLTPSLCGVNFCFKSNRIPLSLGQREVSYQNWSWLVKCVLRYILLTDTMIHHSKPRPAELSRFKNNFKVMKEL